MHTNDADNVHGRVITDLQTVRRKTTGEINQFFNVPSIPDSAKGQRLMLLLQQDLLPGVSGQILEAKGKKDAAMVPVHVSIYAKMLAWLVVIGINFAMLFYVYLFSASQTSTTQDAWFQSFIIWFFMDVFLVASTLVYVSHFLIPSLTMRDVHKIRGRLLSAIENYKRSLEENKGSKGEMEKYSSTDEFNASRYLFVSTRIAQMYPHLRESQIVLKFATPWPRQSYVYSHDISKKYNSNTAIIGRSLGMVAMFFITTAIELPGGVQDMVSEITLTGVFGGVIVGLMDLYEFSPLMAFLPFIVVGILVHFIIYSDRTMLLKVVAESEKARLSRIAPILTPGGSPDVGEDVGHDDSDGDDAKIVIDSGIEIGLGPDGIQEEGKEDAANDGDVNSSKGSLASHECDDILNRFMNEMPPMPSGVGVDDSSSGDNSNSSDKVNDGDVNSSKCSLASHEYDDVLNRFMNAMSPMPSGVGVGVDDNSSGDGDSSNSSDKADALLAALHTLPRPHGIVAPSKGLGLSLSPHNNDSDNDSGSDISDDQVEAILARWHLATCRQSSSDISYQRKEGDHSD